MSQHDPFGPEKYDAYQEPQAAFTPTDRKGPGCLFWGCLISGILFLVAIILVVALLFVARNWAIDKLQNYSEPQPADLPEIQIAQEDRKDVVDRWGVFRQALDEGREAELSLDSDEFNVVAQQIAPEAADHAYFTIEGDQLRGQVSIPVGEVGRKVLRTETLDGRYFNASGTFDVFLRNGLLVLQLQEAEVKGDPVPAELMQQFRSQNLAENVANDPEKRDLFSKFQSIEVEDGRIIFKSKGAVPADVTEPAEGTEPVDGTEPEPASEEEPVIEAAPAADPEAPAQPEPPTEPEEADAPEDSAQDQPTIPQAA